jgi:hypothetical protein
VRRIRRLVVNLLRALVILLAAALALFGAAVAVVETDWAKDQIRKLIVRQANQYLDAALQIGRLDGSLFRGIELSDITLSRDGRSIVSIDEVALRYSLRDLWPSGVVIHSIHLTRPRIRAARQADGRWDLATLVRREARAEQRTGPGRAISIEQIEIVDGAVALADELSFGAAHVPTSFTTLNASMAFEYVPVRWQLVFKSMSWTGSRPDLTISQLTGGLGHGARGWSFDRLRVDTPRSAFTLDGRIEQGDRPTLLDLTVRADRFAFQEWSGIIHGLKDISVAARFDATLRGPLNSLDTVFRLTGTGGSVTGRLLLDTRVPGWHGAGSVDVARIDLARWLNKADRPSEITGRVGFDLDFDFGGRFPRGLYSFNGPHAMYMNYAADRVSARGHITADEVVIENASAFAYESDVKASAGTIGIGEPFPFRFQGTVRAVDLRRVPASIPVPHVESSLTFMYDVTGRFRDPYLAGHASFEASTFAGMTIESGATGAIDTSATPLRFAGEGAVAGLAPNRLGRELDVRWMQDPRYAGDVSGRFQVQGAGTDRTSLALTAGGHIQQARLFRGTLSDADVSLNIDRGTLAASFNGRFSGIDPSAALGDPRVAASATGTADVTGTVRDLLVRAPSLADYAIDGTVTLDRSTVHGIDLLSARFDGALRDQLLTIRDVTASGPAIDVTGKGLVPLSDSGPVDFSYVVRQADLARLESVLGRTVTGMASTSGHLTGPRGNLRATGDGTISQFNGYGINALAVTGNYDVSALPETPGRTTTVTGSASFVKLFGQTIEHASGTVTVEAGDQVAFSLRVSHESGRTGELQGRVRVDVESRALDVQDLTVAIGRAPWHLEQTGARMRATWDARGFEIDPIAFLGGPKGEERLGIAGSWRRDGTGALTVKAQHVFLETIGGAFDRPGRYGGLLDLDARVTGAGPAPVVTGFATITNGRVERITYDKLEARITYSDDIFDVEGRLDQSPGVWLTAAGRVPRAIFDRALPDRPIDVEVRSSSIDLGLIEGLTTAVRNVSGRAQIDMRATGMSRSPVFSGGIDMIDGGAVVAATGSRYSNARASIKIDREVLTIESFHLEDRAGHALDLHGSLGTPRLTLGDLHVDATASGFEVIRNELGRVNVDAKLSFSGPVKSPSATGDITIGGDTVNVDEIVSRTLYRPYATVETPIGAEAPAARNMWDSVSLDLSVHVPQTLKLTGSNIQISPDTPLGLGDINLRSGGDLYLYKEPGQPLYTNGSLYRISGTYRFQGRRFQIDESNSSINFQGDVGNPELYVTVTRIISGVETRVTVTGELRQPELHLASNPPLAETDILSLIVFNASPNDLNAAQRQELVVRAGALAAGFLAAPLISGIEREIGLDVLEIEPAGTYGTGAKLTVGNELAPGLVARFSREFGPEPYDEATIEYYLSRILRLRATFSDAQTLSARSPFRRVERAGIDLLLYFSF